MNNLFFWGNNVISQKIRKYLSSPKRKPLRLRRMRSWGFSAFYISIWHIRYIVNKLLPRQMPG